MADRTQELNTQLTATDRASRVIDPVTGKVRELEDDEHIVEVDADVADADADITSIDRRLGDLTDEDRLILLRLQATQAERDITKLNRQLADAARLDDDEIAIRVEARGDAQRKLDRIQADIRSIDGSTPDISPDVDTTGIDRLNRKLEELDIPLGRVGGTLSSLNSRGAAAGGIAALAVGIGAAANEAANLAIDADNVANLLGGSVDQASRLLAVVARGGVEANDLQDIVLQMNDVLSSNAELAEQLGINLNDGRAPMERFVQVVDLLPDRFEDAGERGLVAAQLFGEEGVRQVNAVTSAVGDLATAIDNVPDSLVITDGDVERAREFKRELGELNGNIRGIGSSVGFAALEIANIPLGVLSDGFGELAEQSIGIGRGLRSIFDGGAAANAREAVSIYNDAVREAREFDSSLLDGASSAQEVRRRVEEAGLSIEAQNTIVVEWARQFGNLRQEVEDIPPAVNLIGDSILPIIDRTLDAALAAERFRDAANEAVAAATDPTNRAEQRLDESDSLINVESALGRVLDAERDVAEARANGGEGLRRAQIEEQRARNGLERTVLRYLELIGGVPDDIVTRLTASIASGDLEAFEREIESLTSDRAVRIRLDIERPSAPVEVQTGDDDDGLDRIRFESPNGGSTGGQVVAPTSVTNYYITGITSTELDRVRADASFAQGNRPRF